MRLVVGATSRPIREYKGKNAKRPCARCGLEVSFRRGKTVCRACTSVMTKWEKKHWLAAA